MRVDTDSNVHKIFSMILGMFLGALGIVVFAASIQEHSVRMASGYLGCMFFLMGTSVSLTLGGRELSDKTFRKALFISWAVISAVALLLQWVWTPIMPMWKIPLVVGAFILCTIATIHEYRKMEVAA